MFIEFTFSSLKFAMLHSEDANAAHVIRATCKINNHPMHQKMIHLHK